MTRELLLKGYMAVVTAAGIAVIIICTIFYPIHDIPTTLFFVALAIVAETQTVPLFRGTEGVSVSSAAILAALLTGGVGSAVWVAAASICGSVSKVDSRTTYHIFNTPIQYTLFNMSNYTLSISMTSVIYVLLKGGVIVGGRGSFASVLEQINGFAFQFIVAIVIGIVLNTLLVAVYLSLSTKGNMLKLWLSNLVLPMTSLIFIGFLGIIVTSLYVAYGWFVVILFFAPLMLARYVFVTYKELQQNYLQTVKSLASAIEAKDEYTIGHSRRVEKYSSMISSKMKLPAKRCEILSYAALLHDIGKIGIREDILNKPGRLNNEEWTQVRTHPEMGAHIIQDVEFLSRAVEIIKCHHEWYNGGGYPQGLSSKDLSLEAMILCVADSYDAMTSGRPYRSAMTHEQAMDELYRKSGVQFCPEIVKAFDSVMTAEELVSNDF